MNMKEFREAVACRSKKEFRGAMVRHNTERVKELENTVEDQISVIANLRNTNNTLKNELDMVRSRLNAMFARCKRIHSHGGGLCLYCGMVEECRGLAYAEETLKQRAALEGISND